jgi:peroxiredoxin
MKVDMSQEPMFQEVEPKLFLDSVAPDFSFELVTGQTLKMSELTQRSAVLVNFIKGTWCPFCRQHIQNVHKWEKELESDIPFTLLFLSTENIKVLREWCRDHQPGVIMGSLTDTQVLKAYGLNLEDQDFARPATLLIERDLKVRFIYMGVRDNRLRDAVRTVVFKGR